MLFQEQGTSNSAALIISFCKNLSLYSNKLLTFLLLMIILKIIKTLSAIDGCRREQAQATDGASFKKTLEINLTGNQTTAGRTSGESVYNTTPTETSKIIRVKLTGKRTGTGSHYMLLFLVLFIHRTRKGQHSQSKKTTREKDGIKHEKESIICCIN